MTVVGTNIAYISNQLNNKKGVIIMMLSTLNSLFNDVFVPSSVLRCDAFISPKDEIHELEDYFKIMVELPGFSKKDIEINMENKTLTITATRDEPNVKHMIHSSRKYGKFKKSYQTNNSITIDSIVASLEEGILTIILPKADDAKSRKIYIK